MTTITEPKPLRRPYVCGHCAFGGHHGHDRCPGEVPVGANVPTGPTRCHCTAAEHHGQLGLIA